MIEHPLNSAWQFRQVGSAEWLPAVVPGGVHTDLLALGRISDPFVGDNELGVMWVAESDWEYRCIFQSIDQLLTEDRIELVCDGLDTLAEVYLNDQLIGQTANMYHAHRWEVKSLLRSGKNVLHIRFTGPARAALEHDRWQPLPDVSQTIRGGQYLRKAPSQFGWDWAPKLPPIGIWRAVKLQGYSHARIVDVHLRQLHASGQVSVSAAVTVEAQTSSSLRVALTITAPDGATQSGEAATNQLIVMAIENPRLWWPNGYGDQPLYRVEVLLREDQAVLDRREYAIGLRTLELRQQDDQWGRSFTFVVNGVPIFAKGANWIPSDSFPTRITDQHLGHLVASAAAANFNMLRVWGGGYYEPEIFYDLCDRHGILIWQDFMFACAVYPLNDPAYVANVQVEVTQVVRRLRQHACLTLWCGNNEMEAGWAHWGWSKPETADLKAADQRFFYRTLPAWIAAEDPDHAYWPSSPSSHTPHEAPHSNAVGDDHLWEVWHGLKPFSFYREQYPRFASEFGFQSLPALSTIATYADESEWNMTSYVVEHHQRHRNGNGKIIAYLTDHFQLPKDFASLVYVTQVLHAEAMRIGVEHWRRNRDRCSGALYWQLNDCWPVASWSSIDYYGRWKALHYAARRFYAPVLLSIEDNDTRLGVFVTNDTAHEWNGEIKWSLETFSGEVIEAGVEEITATPLAAMSIKAFDFAPQVTDRNRRDLVFVCELWRGTERVALTTTLFVPSKHARLQDPHLETQLEVTDQRLLIRLRARSLARFVEVSLTGVDVIFSDNYFDLPAGEAIAVTCALPEGWMLAQAQQAVQVRSLFDSY